MWIIIETGWQTQLTSLSTLSVFIIFHNEKLFKNKRSKGFHYIGCPHKYPCSGENQKGRLMSEGQGLGLWQWEPLKQ